MSAYPALANFVPLDEQAKDAINNLVRASGRMKNAAFPTCPESAWALIAEEIPGLEQSIRALKLARAMQRRRARA